MFLCYTTSKRVNHPASVMPHSLTHDNTIKTTTPNMRLAINSLIRSNSLVVVKPKDYGVKKTHTHSSSRSLCKVKWNNALMIACIRVAAIKRCQHSARSVLFSVSSWTFVKQEKHIIYRYIIYSHYWWTNCALEKCSVVDE